jgi:hypothetical protein
MSDFNSRGNNNFCPIGSVIYWAGLDANYEQVFNAGYMKCDGATLATADYPELYRVIARRWTDGGLPPTAFQVPDFYTYVAPGGVGEVSNLIVPGAAGDSGLYILPTQNNFATAQFTIAKENLPNGIPLEYAAGSHSGSFAYVGNGAPPNTGGVVYTNSNDGGRNTTFKERAYVRSTFAQTTDGGYGLQSSTPSVSFDTGLTPDPVDMTGDISAPANYVAPSFNIVSLIKYKNV